MTLSVMFVSADEVRPLRTQILRPGYPPERLLVFPEDDQSECAHVAAISDGKIIGVATFLLKPTVELDDPQAIQLRGMAVDAQMQGRGIGKCILDFSLEELGNRFSNSKWVWCNRRRISTINAGLRSFPTFLISPKLGRILSWVVERFFGEKPIFSEY
jgi:GNAT superfamily N-acetyltransferase